MSLIAILPGDGIGPEVTAEARRVLEALDLGLSFEEGLVGGSAYHTTGHPLPPETLDLAKRADAILFGAVGDPTCDNLERGLRPEQAILGLRKELTLFANLRPAKLFPGLEDASSLRPEIARKIDLLILRELNGDVYFGEKAMRTTPAGLREGYDIMSYDESEVSRIAHSGFQAAQRRARQALLDRQGERAGDVAIVAGCRDRNIRRNIRTSPCRTCWWTMPQCSWCAIPASST